MYPTVCVSYPGTGTWRKSQNTLRVLIDDIRAVAKAVFWSQVVISLSNPFIMMLSSQSGREMIFFAQQTNYKVVVEM